MVLGSVLEVGKIAEEVVHGRNEGSRWTRKFTLVFVSFALTEPCLWKRYPRLLCSPNLRLVVLERCQNVAESKSQWRITLSSVGPGSVVAFKRCHLLPWYSFFISKLSPLMFVNSLSGSDVNDENSWAVTVVLC